MNLPLYLYALSYALGIITGIYVEKLYQLNQEKREFDKLNKDGNIHITPNTTFTTKT